MPVGFQDFFEFFDREVVEVLRLQTELAPVQFQLLVGVEADLHAAGDAQEDQEAQRQRVYKCGHLVAAAMRAQVLHDHGFD